MTNNRIGIVGGGQLGRMLTFEAKKMGFDVLVLDPTINSPAAQIADEHIVADFKDETAIRNLASKCDFLTFEIELANAKILDKLKEQGIKIDPSPKTLKIIKDKLKQKEFFKEVGIPTPHFVSVASSRDIAAAAQKFGYPILLKARFDAYDGRGNYLIEKPAQIKEAVKKLSGRKLYVEKFVHFNKELAIMVARNDKGEIAAYPVVETIHRNNICHTVFAPAPVSKTIRQRAKQLATKVMKHLSGAGVFGIEMFLTKEGKVMVNEIAPRVHNSGHYTIEACVTSQFAQHVRAITGMPLGSTEMLVPAAVMVNILGERRGNAKIKGLDKALGIKNVAVHIYGKRETKVERKMGHITVIDNNLKSAYKKAATARNYINI